MGAAQHRLLRTAALPLENRRDFPEKRANCEGVSPVPPLLLRHTVGRDKMKEKI
jgi:hypothetical protein